MLFDIQPFLLPSPSAIWSALRDSWPDVWDAMLVTGQNAFVGLVLGIVVGVALSFVLMRFRVANELVTPLAIALNAIPIIVHRARAEQHVREHHRGAPPHHGHD